MMNTRRDILAGLGCGVGIGASAATPALARRAALPIMATFSILADVAAQVGGSLVRVASLVGPDQDAHHYDPKPGDLRAIARSRLVVRNGLGFEGWMDRLVSASGYRGPITTGADGIVPILVRGTIPDPHVWQSFDNTKIYAANIERALARLMPEEAIALARNRARFDTAIEAARTEARALIAPIPANRRLVVVPHNSFRYLGRELGLEFRGLRALSTGAQPSGAALAQLVRDVKASGAAACFVENIGDERLIAQIARETGARVGGRLHSDALSGPNGPAPTTVAMLRSNVRLIAAALRA